MYRDDFLQKKIGERISNQSFRSLRIQEGMIDFSSNDYLGIATQELLHNSEADFSWNAGAKGSRLLSGNYTLIETVEKQIALFHAAEAGLIFNSGYDANIGLLSSVPQKGDTILYDQLSHASLRDGIRLSFAQSFSFIHNNLNDLERLLKIATGNIFIVTESVFSMDGDMVDLPILVAIAEKYCAHIIIDEAHATGIIGEKGEGLVQSQGYQQKIFARIHTFGKAVGCHGAVILGSELLRNYLINFARPFIYSTALPPASIANIQNSYALFPAMYEQRDHLNNLIQYFQAGQIKFKILPSATPIQIILIPGNEAVRKIAAALQAENMDIRAILYPTVPKNAERLRITLHSFNTTNELNKLIALLGQLSK